jgi:hypothetical protein
VGGRGLLCEYRRGGGGGSLPFGAFRRFVFRQDCELYESVVEIIGGTEGEGKLECGAGSIFASTDYGNAET